MKLMHLADLHLGRRHDTVELEADQRDVLEQILRIAETEQPDGVLIAGDVYDRGMPPAEAVTLLDELLTRLSGLCPVFLISGNHDSGERLAFAARLLSRQGVFVSGGFDGTLHALPLGDADVYLLPYLHPAQVRQITEDESIRTMTDAVRAALSRAEKGRGGRRILLAHLFVTWQGQRPEQSDSELKPVGGVDDVDASLFDGFDYVALGHLHGPQRIGRDTVRYAGSPLPYSFSEEHQHKSVTLVEMGEEITIRQLPLRPKHRMRTLTGSMAELLSPDFDKGSREDFIRVCLTDAAMQLDAQQRLSILYPNLLQITYTPRQTSAAAGLSVEAVAHTDGVELFDEFLREKRGSGMTDAEREAVLPLLKEDEP